MRWNVSGIAMTTVLAASPLMAQDAPAQNPQLQQIPQAQQRQQQPEAEVVAKVNGDPITRPELEATVQQRLTQLQTQAQAQGQQLGPEVVQSVQEQSLNLLIESRLVEEHAAEEGPAVEEQEIQSAIDGLKQQLEAQQASFDEFLASRGYTKESLEKRIEGSLAWQKYQQEQLSPENLQSFFEENKDQFQAESFEQAPQQQVVQTYMTNLWEDIVRQKKPQAEIEMVQPQGQGGQPMQQQGLPGQPQQQQQQPANGGFQQ